QGGRACRHRKLHPRLLQSEPAPLRSWLPVAGPLCKDVEHRVSPLNRCFLASALGGQVQDHLSATLSRPALLHEEGKSQNVPLLVEEGWRAATGWCEFEARQDHLSATLSRPALLHEEGKVLELSPPRRGGVARSDGVVEFEARQDH